MAEERITTLHPEGKNGVNIPIKKYEQIKNAILESVAKGDEISFKELQLEVHRKLDGHFEGSIVWHLVSVKQDLEARNVLEIIPKKSPQILRRLK